MSKWSTRLWQASTAILAGVTVCAGVLFLSISFRADAQPPSPMVRNIVVTLNKSQTVYIENTIRTATIASTAIADLKPMTNHTLYIQGKKIGTTNISVFDKNMQLVEVLNLDVVLDTAALQKRIRLGTGTRSIHVSSSNGEVILSGTAPDAVTADRAVSIAKSMAQGKTGVINAMSVAPSQEVMLKVRFLEASRQAERDLGVNWWGTNKGGTRGVSSGIGQPNITPNAGGSNATIISSTDALLGATGQTTPFGVVLANLVNNGTNINVMLSALEAKGLIRSLAEPNLVALSGDTAKFLAGGQFPYPVVTGTGSSATPSIQFKNYGISLAFSPTVLKHRIINLRIAPEVSQLDFSHEVNVVGTSVPPLITRNAQTTVELRDGQSFAIAGLLSSQDARNIDQLPWIGTVPVLGTLFRSSAFQNNETDLVIIVTPHLVRPASPAERLATPLDKTLPSNDVDFFVNGQLEVPKRYTDYVTSGGGLKGPYGEIIPLEQGSNQPVYKGGGKQ